GLTAQNMVTNVQAQPQPVLPSGTLVGIASAIQTFQDALRQAGGLFSFMTGAVLSSNVLAVQGWIANLAATAGEQGATSTGVTTSTNEQTISASEDRAGYLRLMLFYATANTPQPRVIYVVNPNLFELAAQYYGDASGYVRIMQANNMFDPQPIGRFRLLVPV